MVVIQRGIPKLTAVESYMHLITLPPVDAIAYWHSTVAGVTMGPYNSVPNSVLAGHRPPTRGVGDDRGARAEPQAEDAKA